MDNNKALPFFSIIMPTYNRANLIIDSIKTAIAQDYQNFEIIVVDDGSTDNTEEVVLSLNHPKIIYHKKKNEERAVARNTGTQLAKGDYVTFFDSDDYLYPNHLSEAVKLIHKHQNPEMIYLAYNVMDINKKIIKEQHIYRNTDFNKKLINGNYLSCNGVLLRRDVALQHPFNTNRTLSASEDYDLWLRLAARYTIHYSNVITSSILNHDARSVFVVKEKPLIARILLLIETCTNDSLIKKIYKGKLDTFVSKCYLYLALHLAMSKHKRTALTYFYKGIKEHPLSIFDIRVYGIIKCLIIY